MDRLERTAESWTTVLLLLAVTLGSTSVLHEGAGTEASEVGTPKRVGNVVVEADRPRLSKEDILWLARVIYSETKRPYEQELVAWVVRNRYETGYRNRSSYRDVVLDPYQFSAFNPGTETRSFYAGLTWRSGHAGFRTALAIAAKVATAHASERPFTQTTRHFFSRLSMQGGRTPEWAVSARPIAVDPIVEPDRFRFYDRIS